MKLVYTHKLLCQRSHHMYPVLVHGIRGQRRTRAMAEAPGGPFIDPLHPDANSVHVADVPCTSRWRSPSSPLPSNPPNHIYREKKRAVDF
ncbi:hypothetical protein TgHK011_006039 [Trichoderma gracile]|nr:hypothetical protein TgHK011_006039 [Trichoderma gracile]